MLASSNLQIISIYPKSLTLGALLFYFSLPKFHSEVKTMFKIGKTLILKKCNSRANAITRSYHVDISPSCQLKQHSSKLKDIVILYPSYKSQAVQRSKYGSKEENRFTSNLEDNKSTSRNPHDIKSKLKRSNAFR